MRLAHPRLAVPIAVLTLALAGCGGATVTVQEVPGDPVQLTIPGDGAALAPAATATADAHADARPPTPTPPRPRPRPTPETAATPGAPRARPAAGPRRPTTATAHDRPAAPAGSNADEFEDFCAENPGAC